MPEKETTERARADKRAGKSASSQAGNFVREEMHHIREGKHGARSTKQAIAIGLSKARRSGVDLPPPKKGKVSEKSRRSAQLAHDQGQGAAPKRKPSARRSRASSAALKRERHRAASEKALSRHGHWAAEQRSASDRSSSARRASQTKGSQARSQAASKAARTRARG